MSREVSTYELFGSDQQIQLKEGAEILDIILEDGRPHLVVLEDPTVYQYHYYNIVALEEGWQWYDNGQGKLLKYIECLTYLGVMKYFFLELPI